MEGNVFSASIIGAIFMKLGRAPTTLRSLLIEGGLQLSFRIRRSRRATSGDQKCGEQECEAGDFLAASRRTSWLCRQCRARCGFDPEVCPGYFLQRLTCEKLV